MRRRAWILPRGRVTIGLGGARRYSRHQLRPTRADWARAWETQVGHATEPEPKPRRRQGRPAVLLGGMLTVLLLAAVVTAFLGPRVTSVKPETSRTISARLWDASSPYKNTRPGVKYLGDESCTRCHVEIAESYRQHPMGRSLSPIATATMTGGDEHNGRPLFEAGGLEYSIERRAGRVIHKEVRRNSSGRIIAQSEGEVQYVLGSGRRGLTYLVARDGFLIESPITWYSQANRWDLSPGYEEMNHHFDRPVQAGCLYLPRQPGRASCGHAQPVSAADFPGPRNRLRALPWTGRAPRQSSRGHRRPRT